ncbi:MAG TPA: endolytic transglycosylase MltG [Proteobacteria bacterium]|mgnify:CR=1 FL=1|nr:endolytic transglycosylase MltG [Pseudomonadota bacterium]
MTAAEKKCCMRRRRFFIAIAMISGIIAIGGLGSLHLYFFAHAPGPGPEQIILIEAGSSLQKIAADLHEQQLISSRSSFILLNRVLGSATRLQAGEYRLDAAATPLAIIDSMKNGRILLRQVTIPEGFTLTQIGTRLQDADLCRSDDFTNLTQAPDLLARWDIAGENAEGYLFPSTYKYSRQTSCRQLVEMMLAAGQERWRTLINGPMAPEAQALTRGQLITMASIIQKEAGNKAEMPLIASVFYNRLRRGMRLESDPTTIYALKENFDGNLKRRDLRHPSPYNTYRHHGLPPGPICNPGEDALQAALRPDRSDYLYFVATKNGGHQFSRTFREHNQAVEKYQRRPH